MYNGPTGERASRAMKEPPFPVGSFVVLGGLPSLGDFDGHSALRVGMLGRVTRVFTETARETAGTEVPKGDYAICRVYWGKLPDYGHRFFHVLGLAFPDWGHENVGWNICTKYLLSPNDPEAIRLILAG